MNALIVSLVLLVLLAAGAPIAFALIVSSSIGFYMIGGMPVLIGMVSQGTLSAASYELLAIPMFILMAEFIIVSRMADDLFDAAAVWVGRAPGGLGIATVFGGALFGAISGSSTAAAVTLSGTSLPAMVERGYSPRFAGGICVVTATLDMLIPPSIALVFYGLIADVSIGKLLIAGLVPGLIIAFVLVGYITVVALVRPDRVPRGVAYSFRAKLVALQKTWAMLLLFGIITICLYSGIVTTTETSAVAAFVAMLIAFSLGRLSVANVATALKKAARTSCMIALILLGSYLFSYFFALTRTTVAMADWVLSLNAPPAVVLLILGLIYLLLGTFLDTVAMLILTVPIVLPIIVGIGYDPIWYGIMMIMVTQLGILTPPTGMNVFIVAKYANIPAHEVFAGVTPYIILILGVMVIFTIWPDFILWLPSHMN
ncbi:MAG: TRAP transporter large permease [Rhizobiaceae bacterium]|nr:TRAP transporter large permease [Rhizobiaceae bacterium]